MLGKNSKLTKSKNDLQYSIKRILIMKLKIPKPNGFNVLIIKVHFVINNLHPIFNFFLWKVLKIAFNKEF